MSLILAKNPSNDLQECNVNNAGDLKVNLSTSSATIDANVDITGNTVGIATSALQSTGNASLASLVSANATETTLSSVDTSTTSIDTSCSNIDTNTTNIDTSCSTISSNTTTIATDTTSIDGKITQGYDAQVASGGSGLQQNLMYGRDGSGNLDALKTDASGHLEITVDDFVKGQATMANSFPVVLASNQSSIPVSTAGASTVNVSDTLSPGAGGTATSTAVDMDGYSNLTIFGSSDNTSDPIELELSHNNSTWVKDSAQFITTVPNGSSVNFSINISNTGARYWRVQQVDTLTTAFTLTVQSSKK